MRAHTQGMKRSVDQARADGIVPKGLVVINPGNPVGSVLSYEDLTALVIFCKKEGLMLMADEVSCPLSLFRHEVLNEGLGSGLVFGSTYAWQE